MTSAKRSNLFRLSLAASSSRSIVSILRWVSSDREWPVIVKLTRWVRLRCSISNQSGNFRAEVVQVALALLLALLLALPLVFTGNHQDDDEGEGEGNGE